MVYCSERYSNMLFVKNILVDRLNIARRDHLDYLVYLSKWHGWLVYYIYDGLYDVTNHQYMR